MNNEYWLNKWKTKDIAFHEKEINADLITYFNKLNLQPGDYIFVPLCGKTKDILWLANKGLHVVGIELSPIACNEFFTELNIKPHITKETKFIKYQYKNIELICGDFFDLTSEDLPTIHAVYDCKALIALPSDLRIKYLNHIAVCLGYKIKILLLTRETKCKITPPPFPIDENEVNLLYGAYFDVRLLKQLLINNIPERLIKKGYTELTESVYLISEKILK